jgi:SAM-dependent methyltransferase
MKKDFDAVRHCYSTWGETYFDDYYGKGASYPQVQVDILRDFLRRHGARHILDAGCGPASVLRQLTDVGADLYGFDLTPEMIDSGRKVFARLGLDPGRLWEGDALEPSSYRWPGDRDLAFDAIICSGVFPHIPREFEPTVIRNLRDSVRPGGVVAVEARNALFSLFTMNRYSRDFFFSDLINVDALRADAGAEAAELDRALTAFERHFRTDLPPVRKGKEGEPGYDEVLSRLHNPLELRHAFSATGFVDVDVLFYHFHALPPFVGSAAPDLFRRRSLALETDPRDWRGHFMASAFIVTGRRPA